MKFWLLYVLYLVSNWLNVAEFQYFHSMFDLGSFVRFSRKNPIKGKTKCDRVNVPLNESWLNSFNLAAKFTNTEIVKYTFPLTIQKYLIFFKKKVLVKKLTNKVGSWSDMLHVRYVGRADVRVYFQRMVVVVSLFSEQFFGSKYKNQQSKVLPSKTTISRK